MKTEQLLKIYKAVRVKVDKGEEFVKSGKKLISEYPVIRVKPSKLKK